MCKAVVAPRRFKKLAEESPASDPPREKPQLPALLFVCDEYTLLEGIILVLLLSASPSS
jgi:hypothetical protein